METYEASLESWKKVIQETLSKVKALKIETRTSSSEIEMWRSKSAILSTLHQQLIRKEINIVRDLVKKHYEGTTGITNQAVQEFE